MNNAAKPNWLHQVARVTPPRAHVHKPEWVGIHLSFGKRRVIMQTQIASKPYQRICHICSMNYCFAIETQSTSVSREHQISMNRTLRVIEQVSS